MLLNEDQNLKMLSLMERKVAGMLSYLLAPVSMRSIGHNNHLAIIRIIKAGRKVKSNVVGFTTSTLQVNNKSASMMWYIT